MINATTGTRTYSAEITRTLDIYDKHKDFLQTKYETIEAMRGRWESQEKKYQKGLFPDETGSTSPFQQLDADLILQLNDYLSLVQTSKKSEEIFNLLQATIKYCTKPQTDEKIYEHFVAMGYTAAPGKKTEEKLPVICDQLKLRLKNVETIRDLMVSRLPNTANHLNQVCKEVHQHKQSLSPYSVQGAYEKGYNLVSTYYLNQALKKFKNELEQEAIDQPTIDSVNTITTTPETEEQKLADLVCRLQGIKKLEEESAGRIILLNGDPVPVVEAPQPAAQITAPTKPASSIPAPTVSRDAAYRDKLLCANESGGKVQKKSA